MHSANISKREKKKEIRAREDPNRFNFRYGEKAKWLQCKEGWLTEETFLSAERNEAPSSPEAAIYYLQGCIGVGGAFPMGSQPRARGSGPRGTRGPVEGGGRCRGAGQDGVTAGLVTKLCGCKTTAQIPKSPWF